MQAVVDDRELAKEDEAWLGTLGLGLGYARIRVRVRR